MTRTATQLSRCFVARKGNEPISPIVDGNECGVVPTSQCAERCCDCQPRLSTRGVNEERVRYFRRAPRLDRTEKALESSVHVPLCSMSCIRSRRFLRWPAPLRQRPRNERLRRSEDRTRSRRVYRHSIIACRSRISPRRCSLFVAVFTVMSRNDLTAKNSSTQRGKFTVRFTVKSVRLQPIVGDSP